ncbi:neuronal acetylcholine receptor subunit beta-3-like [Physella acuta]|uniref:neuronal acetylcholine receptor subunit beta-3-like n=1 Tax=Physella acuta TaxID=109671 RepID=UPI0027DB0335|nr:neuronal acetylcholine receptor subunit beta-3-like [Physella acuta]
MRLSVLTSLLMLLKVTEGGKKSLIPHEHPLSKEDKLIKTLMQRYRRRGTYARPVKNYNDSILVSYNMQLIQIMDLEEKNQVLTLNVWDRYVWTDFHLTWDPEEEGGVEKIRIPSENIWLPDIKLYNYADERLAERREARCIVDYNGTVLWMPQAIYKSSCEIDVETFPFDQQICNLKFGSWTYNGNLINLMLLSVNGTPVEFGKIDMTEFVESNSWKILNYPAKRNEQFYSCCPGEPYLDLTFTIVFVRRSAFYNNILILPCILLTSLTLVLFWIPPESPAKMMLGINIFVAFFLLLLLMEANLPPAAAKVPLLGIYYCTNMILITLSCFLNILVVHFSFYGARRSLPHCLRMVMFEFFAKVLCMDNLVSQFRDKTITELTSRLVGDRVPFLGMPLNGDKSSKWVRGGDTISSTAEQPQISAPPQIENEQQTLQLKVINHHMTELMDFLKIYKARLTNKDKKDRVAQEWKALSLIFDRIFFFLYLTTIITSLCVFMPMIMKPEEPAQNQTSEN